MGTDPIQIPKVWKTLHSTAVIQTPWFTLRKEECELPNGDVIPDYYVMERSDVVGIVALTPKKEIVLNMQYKHGIGKVITEIPAGAVDAGEDPLAAARRELEEETGYIAKKMHHLSSMIISPTSQPDYFHLYLALDVEPTGKKLQDPQEEIINYTIPVDAIHSAIIDGTIDSVGSIVAVYLALDYLERYNTIS